jgi:Branched-chain amino acid transport protein (AzlD)
MNPVGDGLAGYAVLLVAGVLAHEPWRWLGLVLGRNLDPEGEVFRWVKAVSTALVAGLCVRLVLFPAGALDAVALPVRLVAFGGGIACFFLCRHSLALGIAGGCLLLAGAELGGGFLMR